MRHRFSRVAVSLLFGCSRPTMLKPDPEARTAPTQPTPTAVVVDVGESATGCALPASPKDLVLAVESAASREREQPPSLASSVPLGVDPLVRVRHT